MVWISLIILSVNLFAKEVPKFFTKHSTDAIRFISLDGNYAYLQKRSGVLAMVNNFRTVDFISESSQTDFLVKDSRFKKRLLIEMIPNAHQEMNLLKTHKILAVDWGKIQTKEIGHGRNSKLHLDDEWVSFYHPIERIITLQNILTEKKYQIKLSPQQSPFFNPEVEMISSDTLLYTDINEKGFVGLVQYNLITQKSIVLYKSAQTGTRLELCQDKTYLAIGEFPFGDLSRTSKILQIQLTGSTNLAGYSTIYSSLDADLGNIVCLENSLYFIKTFTNLKKINVKNTEAVQLDLKTLKVQTITDLNSVNQLIEMDDRVLVPFRGDFYVLEGPSNLGDDRLKTPVNNNEELPLEI